MVIPQNRLILSQNKCIDLIYSVVQLSHIVIAVYDSYINYTVSTQTFSYIFSVNLFASNYFTCNIKNGIQL
jgi:hypothetical protein